MNKVNKLFLIYSAWLAVAACLFALTGCLQSAPHVANSEGGTLVRHVDGTLELRQGANAKSITRLDERREDGTRLKAELGTSRDPVVTVPAAPDYTKYIILGIGAIALIGGGVLVGYGWPMIGRRVMLVGGVLVGVGVTVGQFAWLYAIAIVAVGGWLVWDVYKAYRKGEGESGSASSGDTE